MKFRALTCAAVLAALPASAQEAALEANLIPGHPIHHEREGEAGVAMALSITPRENHATNLVELCDQLRLAAGLGRQHDELRLETLFVVPYKSMAVEGYYLPNDGTSESDALVPGHGVPRETLDSI
jgi:hypothetical protein